MEREFVNYELSVKLKELGFNEDCLGYYYDGHFVTSLYRLDKEVVKAPTFSQAFRWFREDLDIESWISPEINSDGVIYDYGCHIHQKESNVYSILGFKYYVEAEDACLERLIEIFEIQKEKKMKTDLKKVNERVAYIVSKLKKKRVNFDDIQFTCDNQKYFITGVKADKGHEELKVYYKWENEGTEYEVDFFDFHNEYFERLLVLIESQLFILGF